MTTTQTKEQKEAIRIELSEKSQVARDYRTKLVQAAVEKQEFEMAVKIEGKPLNDYIIELFYEGKDHTFNTFKGWLEQGKVVKKGEKGFVIWGKPIRGEQKNGEKEVEKTYKMFPISYIFRDDQVKDLD